jgi:hypothetical protein
LFIWRGPNIFHGLTCYIFGIYWKWAGPGASSGRPPPASGGPKRGDEAADSGGGDAAEAEYHLGSSAGKWRSARSHDKKSAKYRMSNQ